VTEDQAFAKEGPGLKEKKILVIAPGEYLPGFQMAGTEVVSPEGPEGVEKALSDALDAGKWGLVIVEESLAREISPRLSAQAFESVSPIVVFIPLAKASAGSAEEYISSVIKGALGYSIKVRE